MTTKSLSISFFTRSSFFEDIFTKDFDDWRVLTVSMTLTEIYVGIADCALCVFGAITSIELRKRNFCPPKSKCAIGILKIPSLPEALFKKWRPQSWVVDPSFVSFSFCTVFRIRNAQPTITNCCQHHLSLRTLRYSCRSGLLIDTACDNLTRGPESFRIIHVPYPSTVFGLGWRSGEKYWFVGAARPWNGKLGRPNRISNGSEKHLNEIRIILNERSSGSAGAFS